MSLLTLKKTLSFYSLVEDMVFRLADPSRRAGGWCPPVTEFSALVLAYDHLGVTTAALPEMVQYIPSAITGKWRTWIRRIWSAPTAGILRESLMQIREFIPGRFSDRTAYAIHEKGFPPNRKRTLEGRHFQGSLEPEVITHWALVMHHLVRIGQLKDSAYKEVLSRVHHRLVNAPDQNPYQPLEFLADIGIRYPHQQDFWRAQLQKYDQNQQTLGQGAPGASFYLPPLP